MTLLNTMANLGYQLPAYVRASRRVARARARALLTRSHRFRAFPRRFPTPLASTIRWRAKTQQTHTTTHRYLVMRLVDPLTAIGTTLHPQLDGFFILALLSCVCGLVWLCGMSGVVERMQSRPERDWLGAETGDVASGVAPSDTASGTASGNVGGVRSASAAASARQFTSTTAAGAAKKSE